jgi:hypothetical protein
MRTTNNTKSARRTAAGPISTEGSVNKVYRRCVVLGQDHQVARLLLATQVLPHQLQHGHAAQARQQVLLAQFTEEDAHHGGRIRGPAAKVALH